MYRQLGKYLEQIFVFISVTKKAPQLPAALFLYS